MNTIHSRQDATAYVEAALTNGGRTAEFLEDFDVDAILDAMHEAGGSWDVGALEPETFWGICERHAR